MSELEKYYLEHQHDENFKNIFNQLKILGHLKSLNEILKQNPQFKIEDFDANYFTLKLISNYEIDFLIKAMNKIPLKLLDSGTRDEEIKEKIIYLEKSWLFPYIYINLFYVESFTIDFFQRIVSAFDKFEQICLFNFLKFNSETAIALVKIVLNDQVALNNLKFIITNFEEHTLSVIFSNIDLVFSRTFHNFIQCIKSNFLTSDTTLIEIITLYRKYAVLFDNEKIIDLKKIVIDFLKDPNRDQYNISNFESLSNFYDLRLNYYKNNQDNKTSLIKSYFGLSLEKFDEKIKFYLSRHKLKPFLSSSEEEILRKLQNGCDNYLLLIDSFYHIWDTIEIKFQNTCKKDLAQNLNIILPQQEIINISTMFYNILAHRIRFNSANPIANQLINNLEAWDNNFIQDSYLATTLINQYCLGMIDDGNCTLGFFNIGKDDILDMGLKDIYSSIHLYRNQTKNNNSEFDLFDNFINDLFTGYNEVTLKRFRENSAIKPDCVICKDMVNDFACNAREYFKIPILLISSFEAAAFMDNHNQELLAKGNITEYTRFLYKMYISFKGNYYILQKYFDADNINNIVNKLIKNYLSTKNPRLFTQILFLLSVLERINSSNCNLQHALKPIETQEFRKKLVI